jgi:chromate transporter
VALPIDCGRLDGSAPGCAGLAAVMGLLGAALYNPLWTGSVRTSGDFAIVLIGFVLLTVWRAPPFSVVILGAFGGIVGSQFLT